MRFNNNVFEWLPQRKLDYETFMLRIQRVQSQLSLPDSTTYSLILLLKASSFLVMVFSWMYYLHLFSMTLVFQIHPVLMLIGFIILGGEGNRDVYRHLSLYFFLFFLYYGIWLLMPCQSKFTAIISYKSFPLEKQVKKKIHLVLHAIALILGIIGIYTAFKNHNESNIPNMYSLHSWIGIGVITLYGIQVSIPLWLLLSNWRVKE